MLSKVKPRRSVKSPVEAGRVLNERYFRGDLPDEYTPATGDPSLYSMPWLGQVGDDEQQPPARSNKIENRKQYIKLASSSRTTSSECCVDHVCDHCSATFVCRCPGCGSSKTRKRGGKGQGAKNSPMQNAGRLETLAVASMEAEKLGRRLAMAASMFAAGFAYGAVTSKGHHQSGQDEEEE